MTLIFEVESFNIAYAATIESTCPEDGAILERRLGWGFGFCIKCGKGWQTGMGPNQNRYINTYPDDMHWSENGMAYRYINHEQMAI